VSAPQIEKQLIAAQAAAASRENEARQLKVALVSSEARQYQNGFPFEKRSDQHGPIAVGFDQVFQHAVAILFLCAPTAVKKVFTDLCRMSDWAQSGRL